MEPSLARDLLTLGLGVLTGILSGAFGVGGAVVSTPGIRLLGADAQTSVGTTLPSVLPSAISGSVRYAREHLVEWRAVWLTAPIGIVTAIIGAELVEVLPGKGHPMQIATAVLLIVSAIRMIRGSTTSESEIGQHAIRGGLVVTGLLAGLLSGLLGIGGGVILVPSFVAFARVGIKQAVATSLVCVALFAVPGTIVHAINGNIDWRFAFWLSVGVIPGARIGATLAIKASDQRLRMAVGWFLAILSVPYLLGEIWALTR